MYQHQTQERNSLGHRLLKFDSIYDVYEEMKHILETQKLARPLKHASSLKNPRSTSWCMNTSVLESMVYLENGGYWKEGAEKLQAIELPPLPTTVTPAPEKTMQLDVVGGVVDINEYLNGEVECMHTIGDIDQAKPVTRIAFAAGFTAMVDSSTVFNRGKAILALCDELEKQGKDVEIYCLADFARSDKSPSWNREQALQVQIKLKSVGQQLAPANFAFIAAHPAFLRRAMFRLVEAVDSDMPIFSYGDIYKPQERANEENFDVYFPEVGFNNEVNYSTRKNAIETIDTILKRLSA